MGFSNRVFTEVANILLDEGGDDSGQLLNNFSDFVSALSIDSGLPIEEVQSRLVEKMLHDSRIIFIDNNVVWLDEILKSRAGPA